jgi:hypothetical protein
MRASIQAIDADPAIPANIGNALPSINKPVSAITTAPVMK